MVRQREPGERLVDRAARTEPALEEDHVGRRPASEIDVAAGPDGRRDSSDPARRADAGDRHVAAEGTALGWEPERGECPLHGGGEAAELRDASRNAGPQDARTAEAREAAEPGDGEREGGVRRDGGPERVGERREPVLRHLAEEFERDVQPGRVDPAEIGARRPLPERRLRACEGGSDVVRELDRDEAAHAPSAGSRPEELRVRERQPAPCASRGSWQTPSSSRLAPLPYATTPPRRYAELPAALVTRCPTSPPVTDSASPSVTPRSASNPPTTSSSVTGPSPNTYGPMRSRM